VTKFGEQQCSFWNNRNIRHEDLLRNINRQPEQFVRKLEEAQMSSDRNNPHWGNDYSKVVLTREHINRFIARLESFIIGHCVRGSKGRRIVMNSLEKLKPMLMELMKRLENRDKSIAQQKSADTDNDGIPNRLDIDDDDDGVLDPNDNILNEYYTEPKWTDVYLDDTGHYNPDKESFLNTVLDKVKKETVFHDVPYKLNYGNRKIEITTPWGEDVFYGTYTDTLENLIIGDRGTEMPVKWGDMYGLSELERNWVSMYYRNWVDDILRSRR
jgi:hypothetical protein